MPFIIYALPRSRTFWLSRFLTFGDYQCYHDQSARMRGVDDVHSWLSQDYVGTIETAAAPWWRLVQDCRPDVRVVTVRRPVDEVVDSLMRVDMRGVCDFRPDALRVAMRWMSRHLDQLEREVPNVMSVRFADLASEATCAAVFEHCLPYQHMHEWWATMAPINLQTDLPAQMRYLGAHAPQISRTIAEARDYLRSLARSQQRRHAHAA